jgi:hypothetical protein
VSCLGLGALIFVVIIGAVEWEAWLEHKRWLARLASQQKSSGQTNSDAEAPGEAAPRDNNDQA